MPQADVLVVGAGAAGLSLVVKIAERFPNRQVMVLTKQALEESNSRYAQGGIAMVSNKQEDSFQKHVEDTFRAGDGLCDADVVNMVVQEGPARVEELIRWGIDFDRQRDGGLALGREGGHTAHRIVHHKDQTGAALIDTLLQHARKLPNVTFRPYACAIDLLVDQQGCYGLHAVNVADGTLETYYARVVVLATGGLGQVYQTTTNPLIATGDGIAMAARAGAAIQDMEFIQFHPTAFYAPDESPAFLISEAIRGAGAHLCTKSGERFMFRYDPRGELASRDIVSRAICRELTLHGDHAVYLDCFHMPPQELKEHFPTIYNTCLTRGIDLTRQPAPVAPAAHYVCGGIVVDKEGRTAIKNLYACGECTRTGLHGANRLASNSLLEALVYGHRGYEAIAQTLEDQPLRTGPQQPVPGSEAPLTPAEELRLASIRRELQHLMSQKVSVVRSNESLYLARTKIDALAQQVAAIQARPAAPLAELRNLLTVASLIVTQSLARRENKGTFFNIDFTR